MTTFTYTHKISEEVKPSIADAIEKMKNINQDKTSSDTNNYCITNVQGKALQKVGSEKHRRDASAQLQNNHELINNVVATAVDTDNK